MPTRELDVTALGFFDLDHDGLKLFRLVGLWGASGMLLSKVVVPTASGYGPSPLGDYRYAELVGDYRYAEIDPVRLLPGRVYVIGAQVPLMAWMILHDDDPEQCTWGCSMDFYPLGQEAGDAPVAASDLTILEARAIIPYRQGPQDPGPGLTFPADAIAGWCGAPNFLYTPVPEPSTLCLLSVGTAVLGRARRRR